MTKAHLLYLQNRVAYARDQEAYKELYIHFYDSIYKLAYIIIQQDVLAEEIISDIMTQVWLMEHKLAYVEHLKTYLLRATRNKAITYLQKDKHTKQHISEDDVLDDICSFDESDVRLLTGELSSIIENTVRQMPNQCQLVFRLIKEEGLSYKEASNILSLSQNTLESHMRTALKKLRLALDGYLLKKKS